jgi:hypothetical protein
MGQYKPMPKMKTTEPSVELKLKKGGKVKKMMNGGAPMNVDATAMRRTPCIPQAVPVQPQRAALLRAKGGKVESMKQIEAHERNEKAEINRVKSELKHHEGMKASKAHKGLKAGGMAPKAGPSTVGGLGGGLEATRPDKKGTTGSIGLSKYKKGGQALAKKMDAFETKTTLKPKINPKDTVHDASKNKSTGSKTGSIEGSKFKRGGAVAAKGMAVARKYETKINDASSKKSMKGGTGDLEGYKYKSGGHVAMTCKSTGGFTAMKKMQKC